VLTELDGLPDPEGERLFDGELLPEFEGESDLEEDTLSLSDGELLLLGDKDSLGDFDSDCECVPPNKPSSLND